MKCTTHSKPASTFRILNPVFCILYSVFCILTLNTFAGFDYNKRCQDAMQASLDLRIGDARKMIVAEMEQNPSNAYAVYLDYYIDAVTLIITEDEGLYEELIDRHDERMDILEDFDDGSPYSQWLQAEMLFYTGLAQVKFGSRFNGATKMISSYLKIKDHRNRHPQFWQNQKLTGIYNVIFDFIPPFMRWATSMFGISGNAVLGQHQLESYTETAHGTPGLAEEAVLVTALAYKLTWQEQKGLSFLDHLPEEMHQNTLIAYLYASTARFAYRNDLALEILEGLRQKDLQVDFYSLDYLSGRCKLNRLEADAYIYLQRYLDLYPGVDYKKDVCRRLSLYYLIHGDTVRFREYHARIASTGQALRDPDQDAAIEGRSELIPDIGLLRAQLLCDGGYFKEAMAALLKIDPLQLDEQAYKIEFYYRKGRILQLDGQTDQAIPELTRAFNDGHDAPYTFATRSALQLGKIYEEKNDRSNAALWYERCIKTYSSEHTTEGVKDMAEKGLKRIK
jgi:tetratricopeptide (TPR) repeat protein